MNEAAPLSLTVHDAPGFPLVTAFAGFLLTVLTFFPGYLSPDSIDQYQQALTFQFTDWHPPIMALLWSILDSIWTGPEPMLLLQAAAFWLGAYALLSVIPTRSPWARALIIALLFSPAVLNFSGVIWKDVQLGSVWACAVAVVYSRRARDMPFSGVLKIAILGMVIYGALVRQNAGLVAGPMLLYVAQGRPWLASVWRTLCIYLVVALLAIGLGKAVNTAIRAQPTSVLYGLLSFDLAGVTTRTGENQYPFDLSSAELMQLRECYGLGTTQDELIWGSCKFVWQRISSPPFPLHQFMGSAWLSAVAKHPVAYVAHRLSYFTRLLFTEDTIWQDGSDENTFGIRTRKHGLYHIVRHYVLAFGNTPVFRPGTWFVLSVLLIFGCKLNGVRPATQDFARTLGIVATLYFLTYLPFGVATDFRYAYLSVLFVVFGFCAIAAEYLSAKSPDQHSSSVKNASGLGRCDVKDSGRRGSSRLRAAKA